MRTSWLFLVATIVPATAGYRVHASRDAGELARTQGAEPRGQLAVLADSERDFGGRQGGSGWFYGHVKANAPAEFIPFPVFAGSPHSAPMNRPCWSLFKPRQPVPETCMHSCLTAPVVRVKSMQTECLDRMKDIVGGLGPLEWRGRGGRCGRVLAQGRCLWAQSRGHATARFRTSRSAA